MKEKERFISIDDSGESIFTFDEADMIIDTKTNIVYGANNVPDLVKILNFQSSQWQKLKEWLNEQQNNFRLISRTLGYADYVLLSNCIKSVLSQMAKLEGEDVKDKIR